MNQILGTVITSVLEYDHLIKITGDPSIINPKTSGWIPADGRSIKDSELFRQTGQAFAPDLRGQFIRGLNQFYSPGEPSIVANGADPNDRTNIGGYSYQKQDVQPHIHPITDPGHQHGMVKGVTIDSWGGNVVPSGAGGGSIATAPQKTGITQTNTNTNIETRPNNISVYYYIKIN